MPALASLVVHSIRSVYFLHCLNGCFENSYKKPIIINMLIDNQGIFKFKRVNTGKYTKTTDVGPPEMKIIYVKVISYFASERSISSITQARHYISFAIQFRIDSGTVNR
jgi:hypothetical protein